MSLPFDYEERTYAGVLGKLIGVYLGRPFEGWSYERIMSELGEINYYVHEKVNVPLIVTDDDIAGTFAFLRALPDHGNSRDISASQIGQSWLNYLINKRTVLAWYGMGNLTEHTAYLRLIHGIPAPQSGSIEMNGVVTAEQIGAQIFIDGWGMVAPGDPELAANLARRAASVSHDGEAIYGAQMIAVMEAQAFVERDLNKLIDTGLHFIPKTSTIYRMVNDLREWRTVEPDWRKTRIKIEEKYGYSVYPGLCHMVPNHALIHLALLYGDDNFQKTLMIVNTSGWDTDCNSGNVGCLMGIKNGLKGINSGPDWRGPVADRLFIPTAEGGRAISDAVRETFEIVNIGRALVGQEPVSPKNGAHFHFNLPGAIQGFYCDETPETNGTITFSNESGHSLTGSYSLALHFHKLAKGRPGRALTHTFIPAVDMHLRGYELISCPTLFSGQTVEAEMEADINNPNTLMGCIVIKYYGTKDNLQTLSSPMVNLFPGERNHFSWVIPDLGGLPIQSVGIELNGIDGISGIVYLDYLTWSGVPKINFTRPQVENTMWRRAWVDAVDNWDGRQKESFRIVQNEGMGMISQGTRDWSDYQIKASMFSYLSTSFGIAVRVQGLRRYYGMILCKDGKARLMKANHEIIILQEIDYPVQYIDKYDLSLKVDGNRLQGWINGKLLFDFEDIDHPLKNGAMALLVEEGMLGCDAVQIF